MEDHLRVDFYAAEYPWSENVGAHQRGHGCRDGGRDCGDFRNRSALHFRAPPRGCGHFHALRRSRESAAEYHVGDSADVRRDWVAFGRGSLPRATDLAREGSVSKCRYGLRSRCGTRLGAVIHSGWVYAAAGEFWFWHGSAIGCRASALRHGPEQRAAEIVFRRRGRKASRATKQCFLRGWNCAGRCVLSFLWTWRGNAEFWSADRVYGGQRRGDRALLHSH